MKVCVLGGTGFVGRHLVEQLTRLGHQVLVPSRAPERHGDLRVLPGLQLAMLDDDAAGLRRHFGAVDAVVNLIGILNERRSGEFARVHVDMARRIVDASEGVAVPQLVHLSALNAAPDAPSRYLRSKWQGEALVARARVPTTIFRPAVLFGRGDSFTSRFARWLPLAPGWFPLARAGARLAPLYVGDLVRAIVRVLGYHQAFGQVYELCGPKTYSLGGWVEYIARLQGRTTRVVPLGPRLGRMQALVLEHLPGKPFTRDNYDTLGRDALCAAAWPPLFAPPPLSPEDVLPSCIRPDPPV